jgi:hypothetical protein
MSTPRNRVDADYRVYLTQRGEQTCWRSAPAPTSRWRRCPWDRASKILRYAPVPVMAVPRAHA